MNPQPGIERKSYEFAFALIRAFRRHHARDQAEIIIWKQLLAAGTSIGANTAESGGAQSRPDWLTRRHIALKEAREAEYWLALLIDTSDSRSGELTKLRDDAGELVAILTAIVRNAKRH